MTPPTEPRADAEPRVVPGWEASDEGEQLVDGRWHIPQFGCDSLQVIADDLTDTREQLRLANLDCANTEAELNAARADAARLEQWIGKLREYAQHRKGCPGSPPGKTCECGLEQLLTDTVAF